METPVERRWDPGWVAVVIAVSSYLLTVLPIPPCVLVGLACAFVGPIVAACIWLGDRSEGRPMTPATRLAFGLSVLFPLYIWLRRTL